MTRLSAISVMAGGLLSASLALAFSATFAFPSSQSAFQNDAHLQPPTSAEMKDRTSKVIANQHHDDAVLDQYERIERVSERAAGQNPRVLENKTYRIVPIGVGTYKMMLKDGDKPVDSTEYRRQLQQWAAALELALKPDDPKMKTASDKYQKRLRDRADLVDAAGSAFLPKWVGSQILNGHPCDVVQLLPNPAFHPRNLFQEALTHATVTVWVDHDSDQIVRGEARITRDISVGAGIFGKLYRGAVFSMDQAEVAPGVWLPVRRQYDYSGRKFLFPFEEHQLLEDSNYRRLGPPNQLLPIVRNEIASGKPASGDP
jgi:hypothetical protein